MNPDDLIFVGLNSSVAALLKSDGQVVWSTELSGGLGGTFVTLVSEENRIYACTKGSAYCPKSTPKENSKKFPGYPPGGKPEKWAVTFKNHA